MRCPVIHLPVVCRVLSQTVKQEASRKIIQRPLQVPVVSQTPSTSDPDPASSPAKNGRTAEPQNGSMTMRYVPILKAKRAELAALSTQQISCPVEPVFEIQNALWDPTGTNKSIGADAASFIDNLRRQWWKPSFVDLSRVASTRPERTNWWVALNALISLPGVPTHHLAPVLSTTDDNAVLNSAKPLAKTAGKALVRVTAPCPDIPALAKFVKNCANTLDLPATAVELLIDWGDSTEQHALDSLEHHAQAILGAVPAATPVIVAGTPDTTTCTQAGQWDFTRREWWLWLRLNAQNQDVCFGDYALFPPQQPGRGRPTYGHLRYSAGDELHIERQVAPTGGMGAGFKMCCDNLVALHMFAGRAFSLGDSTIDDVVHSVGKPKGSPEAWRTIALQHHLRLVEDQLTAPPAAPPAGTP